MLAALGVAAALRIGVATRPGLRVDEVFSLAMATGHSLEHPADSARAALGDYVEPAGAVAPDLLRAYARHDARPAGPRRVIRAVFLSDTNPPLYYLLLGAWARVAGTSDAALRLFSTLCALACFPILWLVARELGGGRTARIACMLFAFSPAAIFYAAEGRMYALLWLLGLGLAWCTLALERQGGRPQLQLFWTLVGATGLLTHYFFAFTWLAAFAWLWFHPGKLRRTQLLALAAVTALVVLPWYRLVPASLAQWRVAAGWLDQPLTLPQGVGAPVLLAWSFLSGRGAWGGSAWADGVVALLFALLAVALLRRGVRRGASSLLARRSRLLWLWLAGATLGPLAFDLLRGSNASLVARSALAGLPAGLALAALAAARLPRRERAAFVALLVLAWLPASWTMLRYPGQRWEPFPVVAERLGVWARGAGAGTSDVVVVHSIPSGVVALARYMPGETPLASWVPQLARRHAPESMDSLTTGRCRVALVKVHDFGVPSPAQAWLGEHATLERRDELPGFTEIQYYRLGRGARDGGSATSCPALGTPAPTAASPLAPRPSR